MSEGDAGAGAARGFSVLVSPADPRLPILSSTPTQSPGRQAPETGGARAVLPPTSHAVPAPQVSPRTDSGQASPAPSLDDETAVSDGLPNIPHTPSPNPVHAPPGNAGATPNRTPPSGRPSPGSSRGDLPSGLPPPPPPLESSFGDGALSNISGASAPTSEPEALQYQDLAAASADSSSSASSPVGVEANIAPDTLQGLQQSVQDFSSNSRFGPSPEPYSSLPSTGPSTPSGTIRVPGTGRKLPRLSINTMVPQTRPVDPGEISPGMKRWQQVRQHVMAPTPMEERTAGLMPVPPLTKRRGIVSMAAGRLGFLKAVENVMGYDPRRISTHGVFKGAPTMSDTQREEVARQRRRFARDIKVCLDACAAEETRRRLQRTSQMLQNAPPDGTHPTHPGKAWAAHHVNNSHYHSETKMSVHSGHGPGHGTQTFTFDPKFSAYAPLLTVLHVHLPSARAKKLWSRTCPHHASILAELGVTFLPDSVSSDTERIQALEVFGTVLRNWAADSAEEELDRWLWLCRAMIVDDRQLRDRALGLLAPALKRGPNIPEAFERPYTASDLESLAMALIELLHAVETSSYPSQDQQDTILDLLYDLSQGSIIDLHSPSLGHFVGGLDLADTTDGVEKELVWLAAARIVASDPTLASWLLDNGGFVLKRFTPPPILHATPPVVLELRNIAVLQLLLAFSNFIRKSSDEHLIESITHMADEVYEQSQGLLDESGAIFSGYLTVQLDLEIRRSRVADRPLFSDPFSGPADSKSISMSHRPNLLRALGDGKKPVIQSTAARIVGAYQTGETLAAVRHFMETPDLAEFGRLCVSPLLERLSTASSFYAIKPFLEWLAGSHPQLFYKPIFACAAATQSSTLVGPLRIVTTLEDHLGPSTFWGQADPQMIVITLAGDFAPRQLKGKWKEGTRVPVAVKPGRYAILVEIVIALSQPVKMPSQKQKEFAASLESKLGTILEIEENEGPLPRGYRALVSQLFVHLRNISGWMKRTTAVRLAVAWYSRLEEDISQASIALDKAQLSTLKSLYLAEGKDKAATRLAGLEVNLSESLTNLLVVVQASLNSDDWTRILPLLWERYGRPNQHMDQLTFLLMKCAELVSEPFRALVTTELADPKLCAQALLKLSMMFGYRFQILPQHTIFDKHGPMFRFPGFTPDFVPTEIGSRKWVTPRDAQDVALSRYGRSMPLELRQRLMELGWTEDAAVADSEHELVPVTMLPSTDASEANAQGEATQPQQQQPNRQGGNSSRPTSPVSGDHRLSRALSHSSEQSGVATTVSKVRRPVLPPVFLALIYEQAQLLENTKNMSVAAISDQLVRMLEREDATRFIRPVTNTLKADFPMSLERINTVLNKPTPGFAYVAINSIVGFLKSKARSSLSSTETSLLLGTVSRLVPFVCEISLRDMRKSKSEHILLPASIYEDEGGFKIHQPWREDDLEVQTAQLVFLNEMLCANRRDVYLIKKMLFNLQVQGSIRHLPFARAWMLLVETMFTSLNSNYNNRAELRHFVNNITSVLGLHGTTDMLIASHAMRTLSLCSARFRRAFASIGFVDVMRITYLTYVFGHKAIKDTIAYTCRSFYRIHQDVFVYQLCLAIAENPCDSAAAYDLLTCLSEQDLPNFGVPGGIRGLNEDEEVAALVQMISDGREINLFEIGSERAKRETRKRMSVSLAPVHFPRENIIRMIVTVIAVNAASPRAIKFLKLFTAILPHIVDPASRGLLSDAVDYLGRFIHRTKVVDEEAMLRFLPGDESTSPDWNSANREYVALVEAFTAQVGTLNIHATRRLIDIVVTLYHTEPRYVGPIASNIIRQLAKTNLRSKPNPIEFLRELAPVFHQFMATVDFTGMLESITELIRRNKYELNPALTNIIVNNYVAPAIRMLAFASEENMVFIVPLRKAAVDLLAASLFLHDADPLCALERVMCSPGLLASVILPLVLLLEKPQDLDRGDLEQRLWVRLLHIVLRPAKPRRGAGPRTINAPPSTAAMALMSLQIIKVMAIRVPHHITAVRGLWTYISFKILEWITDGNARFMEGVVHGAPRLVDWMMWSTFELLVLHSSPLHIDLRRRIQMALADISNEGSRPSTANSERGPRPSPFNASPGRSLSGLVRKPSARIPSHGSVGSAGSTPSPSPTPGQAFNLEVVDTSILTHTRSFSGSSARFAPSTSPSSGHKRLPSVSIREPPSGSTPARLDFSAISQRRASRPVFDAFPTSPRNYRFPSSAPVRSLNNGLHGEKGAIIHLLGPATQVGGVAGFAFPGAQMATNTSALQPSPTHQALCGIRVRNVGLIAGVKRAVHTTMLVYGLEVEDEDIEPYRTWSVQDALHAITEQTKLLAEEELREVFNPTHNDASLLSLPFFGAEDEDEDMDKANTKGPKSPNESPEPITNGQKTPTKQAAPETANQETFDEPPSFQYTLSDTTFTSPDYGAREDDEANERVVVPILSFSHA